LNYIESISGSRFHNALSAISNIKSDFENPLIDFCLYFIMYLFKKLKELSYILSTISLFISRLYHVGMIDRQLLIYFGLSGVLLRSANSFFDGRFLNYECYGDFDYFIFLGTNSDCLDRFLIRFNECINSCIIIYSLIFNIYFYDCFGNYLSIGIMESVISFYLSYSMFSSCILNYSTSHKFFLESSKGIYCIFLANVYLNIISNDYLAVSQLNSFCRVYNLGDLIAMLGSIDFVSGSIDLIKTSLNLFIFLF
jgi:NADH-quinone oxidoreductase subunit D